MITARNQSGLSTLKTILALLVIIIIATIGYLAYRNERTTSLTPGSAASVPTQKYTSPDGAFSLDYPRAWSIVTYAVGSTAPYLGTKGTSVLVFGPATALSQTKTKLGNPNFVTADDYAFSSATPNLTALETLLKVVQSRAKGTFTDLTIQGNKAFLDQYTEGGATLYEYWISHGSVVVKVSFEPTLLSSILTPKTDYTQDLPQFQNLAKSVVIH